MLIFRVVLLIIFFLSASKANECQKKLFDMRIMEAVSIEESLEHFSNLCSFSIVVKDDLAKDKLLKMQKNINVSQMSLDEIFDLLIKENNLNYEFDGKILKISGLITQSFKINYITSVREGQSITKASVDAKPKQAEYSIRDGDLEDNMIKTSEKFDFWITIEKELLALLNNGREVYEVKNPIINSNAGIITITGTNSQIARANVYLKELEQRLKKQVIIDVSIIAVNLDNKHTSGINWQNFNLNFATTTSDGKNSSIQFDYKDKGVFVKNLGFRVDMDFSSVLNFLSQSGKTQVLSNPKLMALNNQQAIISIGDTINYQVKESSKGTENGTTVSETYNNYSIFVGILLNILPEISDDGKIMLRINPSLSNFKYAQDNRRQNTPRTIAPDTIQKKLSTVVQVENNQSLILGGLISRNNQFDESSVNFLSKIPLLGALFQGDQSVDNATEIVFIITPVIVDNQNTHPSLKDLGFKHYEL